MSEDQDTINDMNAYISSVVAILSPASESSSSRDSVARCCRNAAAAHVRLPKLELKRFSGDPHSWVSFINLIDFSTHTEESNVIKIQYLLSILSEEPLNLVRSLNNSSDNYYNNRRLTTLNLNQIVTYRTSPILI